MQIYSSFCDMFESGKAALDYDEFFIPALFWVRRQLEERVLPSIGPYSKLRNLRAEEVLRRVISGEGKAFIGDKRGYRLSIVFTRWRLINGETCMYAWIVLEKRTELVKEIHASGKI